MSSLIRLNHNTSFINTVDGEKVQVKFYVIDKDSKERADVQTVVLNNIIEYIAFRELLANLPSIDKKIDALKSWEYWWDQQVSNIEKRARNIQHDKDQEKIVVRRRPTFEDIKSMLK